MKMVLSKHTMGAGFEVYRKSFLQLPVSTLQTKRYLKCFAIGFASSVRCRRAGGKYSVHVPLSILFQKIGRKFQLYFIFFSCAFILSIIYVLF